MIAPVHVAVAVIKDDRGRVLIARRPKEKHMGGFWEFPGGKVEEGESVQEALKREILEEVNVNVGELSPLIQIPWQYPNKQVFLDVFTCRVRQGEAHGCEGQEIKWLHSYEVDKFQFPPANKGILNAIKLPDKLLVTGAADRDEDFFLKLDRAIDEGVRLVQLRDLKFLKNTPRDFLDILSKRYSEADPPVIFLLNTSPEDARQYGLTSLHLKSKYLKEDGIKSALERFTLVSASVHNEQELELANQLNLDFILLSPVQPTHSHPEAAPIGWDGFQALVNKATMPVYALGGLSREDIAKAKALGAQGVAAISAFWK